MIGRIRDRIKRRHQLVGLGAMAEHQVLEVRIDGQVILELTLAQLIYANLFAGTEVYRLTLRAVELEDPLEDLSGQIH